MEKIVALVGRAVSSRRITASHGLAQNQIAVAFVVRDNGREIQKAQPLEKIVSAARDFTLRQGAHTKHSNVAVAFGNGFKLGKSYAGSRKQPATNLWTTRASQGKKTLTNPYDRSLIALS